MIDKNNLVGVEDNESKLWRENSCYLVIRGILDESY